MREAIETFNVYLWIVIHHRKMAISCAIILCIAGWIGTSFIPDKYAVEAKVYMDSKTVLEPLLKGIAVDNTVRDDTAMLMRRTLLTRPNLIAVARAVDLDLKAEDDVELEAIVQDLRDNIAIDTSAIDGKKKNRRDSGNNIYSISYIDKDPGLAKKVVESLLNIFVENILGKSRKDSDQAQAFLNQQVTEYKTKLEQAEEKLKVFKQTHVEVMPDKNSTFYSNYNKQRQSLEEAQLQLKEKINQSNELKRQIDALIKTQSNSKDTALLSPSPLDKRIETLQVKLDELLLQYTDEHPDVVATRRMINELENQKKTESGSAAGVNSNTPQLINSNLYQELNIRHGEVAGEIAALRARVDAYQQKANKSQSIIEQIPQIESEYTKLTRDYDIIKKTYDELLERKTSADLSRQAENSSKEFQFNIVEPPVIPLTPTNPNRLLLVTLVLLIGIGGGVAVCILYELIKPTIYQQNQIEEAFDLPVLGCLSMSWSETEFKGRRREIAYLSLAFIVLLIIYLIILSRYMDTITLPFDIPFLD